MSQTDVLSLGLSQPTVRFAEDTLLLPREDGESEEGQLEAPWPLPGERQRLIRKDTPHYKKHFKISKLPQPEAVVALLQGTQPDSEGPVGSGGWHKGPHVPWAPRAEEEEEEEDEEEEEAAAGAEEADEEEEEREEAVVSAPSVKVGLTPRASPSRAGQAPRSALAGSQVTLEARVLKPAGEGGACPHLPALLPRLAADSTQSSLLASQPHPRALAATLSLPRLLCLPWLS